MTARQLTDTGSNHNGFVGRQHNGVAVLIGAALSAAPAMASAEPQWHLQTGGLSHHFAQTDAPGRQWNDSHPGLGVEYRNTVDSNWSTRLTVGLMRDSRQFASGYAGGVYLYDMARGGGASASMGLGLYAFYRSSTWDGDMQLVPAIAPTFTFGLLKDRVGISVIALPKVTLFGRSSTPLVFAQLSFRYN